MKVLLTGITGNLGYEVSLDLARRGIDIIPCVRSDKKEILLSHPVKFKQVVECDLVEDEDIYLEAKIDCIVHCAGIVKFREAKDKNEQMMRKVTRLAKSLSVPVYAISTAFVHRPLGTHDEFNNDYEKDKFKAEQVLISSGVPHTIIRPSVLTGNSLTGEIQNFSGYYLIVQAFLSAIYSAKKEKRVIRFPRMSGKSNMIPVDQAAKYIGKIVQEGKLDEIIYVTNPLPPSAEWVMNETLNFYEVSSMVNFLDISFQEFGKLNLTEEETKLYRFAAHFNPYWSMKYEFPTSVCEINLVDSDYLKRILTFFNTKYFTHEQKTN